MPNPYLYADKPANRDKAYLGDMWRGLQLLKVSGNNQLSFGRPSYAIQQSLS